MLSNNSIHSSLSGNTLTILLIEDDISTVSLLEYLFTRRGFHVQIARDGKEAQTLIQSSKNPPELVLMDLMLPYVNGYELLQIIRKLPAWEHVPVLVLSGKSQEEDVVRAFKLGASDYVVKPFRLNELMARIAHLAKLDEKK